ncbi:O-antigen ligase family protein [Streptomyces sp. MMS24-I2-30]|uniref:O-antigen ligase family protein n=1 Tax=Streptomyces sp. MMS24-I2-30 TaxID=3351564 RepID=UPI003896ED3F
MTVLGACAAWSLIAAAAHDGRPEDVLLAVLAVTAGYASGRIAGALLPVAAPCAAALAGLGLAVAVPAPPPGLRFDAPPGHAGATAALLALATGAVCCAAWATAVPGLRIALRLSAAVIVLTGAAVGSAAGCVLSAGVLLWSLAAGRTRHRGRGILGLGLVAALVTGVTWAVAGNVLPAGPAALMESLLTTDRVRLWRDALCLARRNPVLGTGPGRFGEHGAVLSPTAPPDARPHSAPLQQAAEQGLTGAVLLVAVFCWVLYALWRASRTAPVALTAGAALTALAVVAAVGNALSFTTVSAGAGLLAGLATAHPLPGDAPEPGDGDVGGSAGSPGGDGVSERCPV